MGCVKRGSRGQPWALLTSRYIDGLQLVIIEVYVLHDWTAEARLRQVHVGDDGAVFEIQLNESIMSDDPIQRSVIGDGQMSQGQALQIREMKMRIVEKER